MENKQLEVFFKNIQKGLKKFTLDELNDSIDSLVNTDADWERTKGKEIATVIGVICKEFEIEKEVLLYGRSKGKTSEARRYAACILHIEYNLPIRFIAKSVFKLNWHTGVTEAVRYYKSLNMEVKPDREFSERLQSILNKIATKNKNTNV